MHKLIFRKLQATVQHKYFGQTAIYNTVFYTRLFNTFKQDDMVYKVTGSKVEEVYSQLPCGYKNYYFIMIMRVYYVIFVTIC